ncbi:TIGR03943 family putative permease subunit [Enterococcus sp. DIV0876]|uniref:TIGR03943 family putative permease subunit n=1 Tax=Enterococcus sp. DIV0876 TaxID=2774633 RepID=UPI003D2FBB91
MIRFLILSGYFELMMYLQVSGKLNQFINVHYRYLAILSMVISLVLALVQLYFWVKQEPAHHHEDDHQHGLEKKHQRLIAYLLLALPIIVGLFFPTVSLDTTIVEAKGFNFPLSEESVGDPEMTTQYLKPDTSLYFNKDDYNTQMETSLAQYVDQATITITDENYLEVMELIYTYPSEFIGKKVTYEGFVYHQDQDDVNDIFLFRFGIIHCVADSGVFGLRMTLPAGTVAENNQWLQVEGTIQSQYYAPFKRDLPMVAVKQVSTVAAPDNQYVYRAF